MAEDGMRRLGNAKREYFKTLVERGRRSRIHTPHQLIGLMIAETLDDRKHKSLYMKLAKELKTDRLLELARSVAERRNVSNRGAYFMRLVKQDESLKIKKRRVMKRGK